MNDKDLQALELLLHVCVAVRCSVVQCVAVWCSVVQCGAVWAVCCSVVQCVAV